VLKAITRTASEYCPPMKPARGTIRAPRAPSRPLQARAAKLFREQGDNEPGNAGNH
jgi:hypothetical protein